MPKIEDGGFLLDDKQTSEGHNPYKRKRKRSKKELEARRESARHISVYRPGGTPVILNGKIVRRRAETARSATEKKKMTFLSFTRNKKGSDQKCLICRRWLFTESQNNPGSVSLPI